MKPRQVRLLIMGWELIRISEASSSFYIHLQKRYVTVQIIDIRAFKKRSWS